MNVCTARMLLKLMNEPEEKTEVMPHESDGRVFWEYEDVKYFDDVTGIHRIRTDRIQQFCCKHCGCLFLEDSK